MTTKSEKSIEYLNVNPDAKIGQKKCPKCGSTDIMFNSKTGKLRCNFCRHEFTEALVDSIVTDIKNLNKKIVGKGAQNIAADAKDMMTIKCSSCGAEVVVDTSEATHKRCHWCRNTLSINEAIPNGAVPDMVLPFKVLKEDAKTSINEFVKNRQFYAHPKFKKEFTTDNILGVYLPYLVIDMNAHSLLKGIGEVHIRSYKVGSSDHQRTVYDADVYKVSREFDIAIHDLTVESSGDKLDYKSSDKTTNIINSVMPFDTENCVKWDANYLKGFTSEKRNTNVTDLEELIILQAKDVARHAANKSLTAYDRGVKWNSESLAVKGEQCLAAYLPVWIYSYKCTNNTIHYVAVNARSKETMGSVPINYPKLLFMSCLVELVGILGIMSIGDFDLKYLLLIVGFIYYFYIYSIYRNDDKRHTYERETKTELGEISGEDTFMKSLKGISNSKMNNANNYSVNTKTYSEIKKSKETKTE